jgi:hypothetical protein
MTGVATGEKVRGRHRDEMAGMMALRFVVQRMKRQVAE